MSNVCSAMNSLLYQFFHGKQFVLEWTQVVHMDFYERSHLHIHMKYPPTHISSKREISIGNQSIFNPNTTYTHTYGEGYCHCCSLSSLHHLQKFILYANLYIIFFTKFYSVLFYFFLVIRSYACVDATND